MSGGITVGVVFMCLAAIGLSSSASIAEWQLRNMHVSPDNGFAKAYRVLSRAFPVVLLLTGVVLITLDLAIPG